MGNTVAPQDVLKQYGADILRIWVVASDYSEDLRIGPEILKGAADSYRRLRNTMRFLLGNLAGWDEAERVDPEEIRVLYVEGYPRWEYRFLKNTLLRAKNMKAQCLLLDADVDFMQGMIHHHAQALVMTSMVRDRAASKDLTILARRIEFAQDTDGFWLEPHSDLGVKSFTMLLYLSTDPSHSDLGTDIYDADKNHVGRSPFESNAAMIFVPVPVRQIESVARHAPVAVLRPPQREDRPRPLRQGLRRVRRSRPWFGLLQRRVGLVRGDRVDRVLGCAAAGGADAAGGDAALATRVG